MAASPPAKCSWTNSASHPKGFLKESRRGVGGRVILANEERSDEYRF